MSAPCPNPGDIELSTTGYAISRQPWRNWIRHLEKFVRFVTRTRTTPTRKQPPADPVETRSPPNRDEKRKRRYLLSFQRTCDRLAAVHLYTIYLIGRDIQHKTVIDRLISNVRMPKRFQASACFEINPPAASYALAWNICTSRCGNGILTPSRSKLSFTFSVTSK